MSSVYALEPRTRGRVVLQTTHGPVNIGLWSDEQSSSVRAFLLAVLSHSYDDLPFHRVIPSVLAQTGDPSCTGSGGVFPGRGVRRESHGRLRFRRRGLVALVEHEGWCKGQFFVSLGETKWMDGKHTIFGTVEGDSIYNAVELGNGGEVEDFETENGARVVRVEVVDNPFPDLVDACDSPVDADKAVSGKVSKRKSGEGGRKDRGVLSFGAGGGDESDDSDDSSVSNGAAAGAAPERQKQSRNRRDEESKKSGKRPRGSGMKSSHELLNPGQIQLPSSDKVAPPSDKLEPPVASSRAARPAPAEESAPKVPVTPAEIAAAAEAEFAALQAELLGSADAGKAGVVGASNSKVAGDRDSPEDGDGGPAGGDVVLPALPGKYANLRRGIKRSRTTASVGGRGPRTDVSAADARADDIRKRVKASAGMFGRIDFGGRGIATGGDEDDGYEVVDARDGRGNLGKSGGRGGGKRGKGGRPLVGKESGKRYA